MRPKTFALTAVTAVLLTYDVAILSSVMSPPERILVDNFSCSMFEQGSALQHQVAWTPKEYIVVCRLDTSCCRNESQTPKEALHEIATRQSLVADGHRIIAL